MLKPLFDNVVVKPQQEEKQGEIYLPENSNEKIKTGVVVAVGNGKPSTLTATEISNGILEFQVKKDDIVVYKQWAGNEIKNGSDTFIILKQSDILAIVENE